MIQPGTWLKWYVSDAACRQPIYFRFIGRLTLNQADGVTYVLDSQWHQRLYVNDWFLNWLLPLEDGEEGQFINKKKFVPRGIPEKPKKNPLASAPPQAVLVPDPEFPRLLSKTVAGQ